MDEATPRHETVEEIAQQYNLKSMLGYARIVKQNFPGRRIILVADEDEQSNLHSIYGPGRNFYSEIVRAYTFHKKTFIHKKAGVEIEYRLGHSQWTPEFHQLMLNNRRFGNQGFPPTIHVYSGKYPQTVPNGEAKIVFVRIPSVDGIKSAPLAVYYSFYRDEYYINIDTLDEFRSQHPDFGVPYLKLQPESGSGRSFETWNRYSPLALYGYSVARNSGLSRGARQSMLAAIIDHGIMEPAKVYGYIEQAKSLHQAYQYKDAQEEWKADLNFVAHHPFNPTDIITPNFAPRRKNIIT